MQPDEQRERGRAEIDAELASLRDKVSKLTKQLSAQRAAFDRRGRALIGLRNDYYRLRRNPLQRFWSAADYGETAATSSNPHDPQREARFRETEMLTRLLMQTEEQLAKARRQISDRRFLGLFGRARKLARLLLRR